MNVQYYRLRNKLYITPNTILLPWLVCLFLTMPSYAAEKNSQTGFLDFNVYPYLSDVDNDNVITINAFAKLESRLSYFSLTNFGNQDSTDELSDIDTFYTEQNLRWQISEASPLDLTLQMNFRTGKDNDRHRLGVRWRPNDTNSLKTYFLYYT